MKRNNMSAIQLNGLNEFVQSQVEKIELTKLHTFPNHPFNVDINEEMHKLVDSIVVNGVLSPITIRPLGDDKFQIISGHRRVKACELAGLDVIPYSICDCTDEEAVIKMVDSNIQRNFKKPSEKAFSYRMKSEALKHQGVAGGDTADEIGASQDESGKNVRRYIRLTHLIPDLLELVDQNQIKFVPAVELSYLRKEVQGWVYDCLVNKNGKMTLSIAQELKVKSKKGTITKEVVEVIMQKEVRKNDKFILSKEQVTSFFSLDWTNEMKSDLIYKLLEEWKLKES